MSKPPSNLALRILTALVGVPAILALVYVAPPWALFVFVEVATLLSAIEFFSMTHAGDRPSIALGSLLTLVISSSVYFSSGDPRVLLTLLIGSAILAPLLSLLRPGDLPSAAVRMGGFALGPLYVGVPLALLAHMRIRAGFQGGHFVLMSLGFAWMSDTFGYFFGRFLGKHKLYELVSPKKTLEGALGGLLGAASWGAFGALVLGAFPLAHGLVLGVIAGAFGQAGDLGESLLKRSVGVKDSGTLLPGHGGLLDRVDALLVTSSIVYVYLLWFR